MFILFYSGIDIGKYTHVTSFKNDNAKIIFKAFSFPNSSEGAQTLLQKLQSYCSNLEIDMETTGHY